MIAPVAPSNPTAGLRLNDCKVIGSSTAMCKVEGEEGNDIREAHSYLMGCDWEQPFMDVGIVDTSRFSIHATLHHSSRLQEQPKQVTQQDDRRPHS